MENYQTRSRRYQNQQPNKKRWQLVLVGLLALVIIIALVHNRQRVATSYAVNETATVSSNAKLHRSLTGHFGGTRKAANSRVAVNKYYLVNRGKKKTAYAQVTFNGQKYYTQASNLKLTMTNGVNRYVAQLGYPHA